MLSFLATVICILPFRVDCTCFIDCRATASDVPQSSADLRSIMTASIGGYSVDFPETCPLSVGQFSADSADPDDLGFYEFRVNRVGPPPSVINRYIGKCPDLEGAQYFKYLDTIQTSLFINSQYPNSCNTTKFVPDASFVPVSETRPQKCVFGARLVEPVPGKFGALFPETKQPVAFGFDTTFRFTVTNKSEYCRILQQEPLSGASKKCITKGGRGFAFVIQNAGSPGNSFGNDDLISYQIKGVSNVNLGYNFPRNVAIEFDYFFDPSTNDPNWNHVAVMVPNSRNSFEADTNSNSAIHTQNMLAIADSISLPPLDEGIHKVQIVYEVDTNANIWQEMMSNEWLMRPLTQVQQQMLTWWSYGRIGTLTILLNDVVIIKTFLDLSAAVQAEPISSPNPGSAWVGFIASTGPTVEEVASPIILSWTWSSPPSSCPSPSPTLSCLFGHKVSDISSTSPRPGGESDVQFFLRNIARANLKLFANLNSDQRQCIGPSVLAWNQIHPYYEGCEYPVAVGPNLDSLIITDESGSRTVTVNDPQLINRDFQSSLFIRRSTPEYCVIEHQSDYYKLFFGQCDCAYCVRIFTNQRLYSVFYNQICSLRYTYSCKCFEVSQMTRDAFASNYQNGPNPWRLMNQTNITFSAQLMQYQEHTVCRGCSFDYHCNFMLPGANCDTPITVYRVGNPLEPVRTGSFQNWNRGQGAEDGIIKGNACNCLDRSYEPEYLNSRNQQVHVSAYLSAYIPTTAEACLTCLKIGGSVDCSPDCGYPVSVNLLHYPNGQACSTCTLSSLALMNIPTTRLIDLRSCVYSAIQDGLSPWDQCKSRVSVWTDVPGAQADPETTLFNLLNGVATHFLTECPGADFSVRGAVCAPNLYAIDKIPMQMITSQSANAQKSDGSYPIWWDDLQCMNAMCELTRKSSCYEKLIKIVFSQHPDTLAPFCFDLLGGKAECTLINSPTFDLDSSSIVLDRSSSQYGYTDPLPLSSWSSTGGLKSKSLEVWARVSPTDVISDMVAAHANGLSTTNSWGDDYVPSKATRLSDATSYWHSRTSIGSSFEAVWKINFGPIAVKTVQSIKLNFHQLPPTDFTVEASVDGGFTWNVVDTFTNNQLLSITSNSFFKFNAIRIVMTKAAKTRTYGLDSGKFAYAMSGFGAFSNLEVSRLKPTQVAQHYSYGPQLAFDNSLSTWWSITREYDSVASGWISLSFSNVIDAVLVRVVSRLGYTPSSIAMTISTNGGQAIGPVVCASTDPVCVSGSVTGSPEIDFSLSPTTLSGIRLDLGGVAYYDDSIVQISEIEIFRRPSSPSTFVPTICGGNACTFPIIVTGPTTYQFSAWQLPTTYPFGSFTLTLSSYSTTSNAPATISVRSPSSFFSLPTIPLTPIGSLSFSFSIFVEKNSDVALTIAVPSGTAITLGSVSVSTLEKVNLADIVSSVSASNDWSETIVPTSSVAPSATIQGSPNNMFDLDEKTEFRTKIGAPSFVGTMSSSPDFVLTTNINRVINIDAVFLSYSFRSRWFRFRTRSLVSPSIPDAVCEWIPSMTATTGSGCANSITTILPSVTRGGLAWKNSNPYSFAFSQNPIGNNLPTNRFELTLMQSSAVDTVANNQPIIGIRELGVYSAYETTIPATCSISTSFAGGNGLFSLQNCQSVLFDKNFTTFYSATSVSVGGYYLDFDLGSATQVKDFTIYWGPSAAGVPTQVRIYSSNTPTSSVCDVSAADSTASDFAYLVSSQTAPIVYTDPSGYIERPVRCFRISFDSIPASGYVAIAEISIRLSEPSFGAVVAGSSLINPSNALDPVSVSAAVASSANSVLNHYIMIDLNPPRTYPPGTTSASISADVWGLFMIFTGSSQLDKTSIKLYVCDPSIGTGTLADCISGSTTTSVSVPFTSVTSLAGFVFGPLNCLGCTRVAITLNALSGSSGSALFAIGSINIFASFNQARFGGITASLAPGDDRGWDYSTDKAVDGDSASAWVSEPDVNSAEFLLSLIPEGPNNDPLSISYIPAQSASVPPTHVATITVNFLYPMIEFAIDTSITGTVWTEQLHIVNPNGASLGVINDLLYANYIRVRLIRAYPLQTPLSLTDPSQSIWYSALMGITSIAATTLTNLATGTDTSAVGTVASSSFFAITTQHWMSMPPGPVSGVFTLTADPALGIDVSGLELQWYHAPLAFTFSWTDKNGAQSTLVLTSQSPKIYTVTQFMSQVYSFSISINSFAPYNGINMALFKQLIVYKPNMTTKLGVQSVSASNPTNTTNLVDGNMATYWSKSGTPSAVTLSLTGGNNLISTIVIVWGTTICTSFTVSGTLQGGSTGTLIYSTTNNVQQTVTVPLLSSFYSITIDMFAVDSTSGGLPLFSIAEVSVYGSVTGSIVSRTQTAGVSVNFDDSDYAIDAGSGSADSMWMVSPVFNYGTSSATITVTLGTVYKASKIEVVWGWTPWDATTLNIANQLRQYVIFTDSACSYSDPLNYQYIQTGFTIVNKIDTYSNSVSLKCLSLIILAGAPDFGGSVLGPSVKDISITLDQNLIEGNQQYVDDTQAAGWWNFPASLMADGSNTTSWLSKKQSTSAELRLDLGQVYNLAGIDINFLYPAGVITYTYSQQSCATANSFIVASGPISNTGLTASLSGLAVQFVARCVRVLLGTPLNSIANPDSQSGPSVSVFGVSQLYVYKMVGGGGVFGIEARDPISGTWGTVFDSIAFGPYQPNQWHMLSENQQRSKNVDGDYIRNETTGMVQIVATFSTNTVTLYRNGIKYGSSYLDNGLVDWSSFAEVRLVFGLASSQFESPATLTNINSILGSPPKKKFNLNPYFAGSIQSMTLLSQALSSEEVMGLYLAQSDYTKERACHCYDACPTGSNKFYPTVQVPCSGQGVCLRQYDEDTGLSAAIAGVCRCSPGFSGSNCQTHCSDTPGGCCTVNDDCPVGTTCNTSTNYCQ